MSLTKSRKIRLKFLPKKQFQLITIKINFIYILTLNVYGFNISNEVVLKGYTRRRHKIWDIMFFNCYHLEIKLESPFGQFFFSSSELQRDKKKGYKQLIYLFSSHVKNCKLNQSNKRKTYYISYTFCFSYFFL